LTIIDTRAEEVGAIAARMLLDMLDGRTPERHQVLVAPSLLPGESTGPRRRANGHTASHSATPVELERG
jgi:DNA-binding LacI/PurR family transcriptional regulator